MLKVFLGMVFAYIFGKKGKDYETEKCFKTDTVIGAQYGPVCHDAAITAGAGGRGDSF